MAAGQFPISNNIELNTAVRTEVAAGGHVEWLDDMSAVVSRPQHVSHVAHAILTLVTFGIWAPIWASCFARRWRTVVFEMTANGGVQREVRSS